MIKKKDISKKALRKDIAGMALGERQRNDIGIVSGKNIRNDISKKLLRKDIAGISSGNVSGKDIRGMASGEGQRNDIGSDIRNNIRRAGQILSGEG